MSQECFEFVVYIIHACAKKWNMTPFFYRHHTLFSPVSAF